MSRLFVFTFFFIFKNFSFTTLLSKLCMGNKKKKFWATVTGSQFIVLALPLLHTHTLPPSFTWVRGGGVLPFFFFVSFIVAVSETRQSPPFHSASLKCVASDAHAEGKAEWVIKLLFKRRGDSTKGSVCLLCRPSGGACQWLSNCATNGGRVREDLLLSSTKLFSSTPLVVGVYIYIFFLSFQGAPRVPRVPWQLYYKCWDVEKQN